MPATPAPEFITARASLPSFSAFLSYWRANPQVWSDVPSPFLLVPAPAQPAARAALFARWQAYDAQHGTTIADEYRPGQGQQPQGAGAVRARPGS